MSSSTPLLPVTGSFLDGFYAPPLSTHVPHPLSVGSPKAGPLSRRSPGFSPQKISPRIMALLANDAMHPNAPPHLALLHSITMGGVLMVPEERDSDGNLIAEARVLELNSETPVGAEALLAGLASEGNTAAVGVLRRASPTEQISHRVLMKNIQDPTAELAAKHPQLLAILRANQQS